MKKFLITARTPSVCITFSALARTSGEAAVLAAEVMGDQPCGITVVAGAQ